MRLPAMSQRGSAAAQARTPVNPEFLEKPLI
jgi:hypothetical protein